ncbi:MAG: DUF4350 domain-containing protein [Chloracidobacterium sp.]|nr:DUF4350 domain-containing protein [Chloracidobacterium sp.]MDW8217628.1 DUF4350 domain-containing protein [Acidobacteriota bacterium]
MSRQTFKNGLVVALVVALLLGLNLLFYVKPEPAEESDVFADRSTHSGRAYGTLAAYLLLQESGLRVSRWEQDYRALADNRDVRAVIFVEPREKPGPRQLRALRRWIVNGGTFIVFERAWPLALGGQELSPSDRLPLEATGSAFGKAPLQSVAPWQPGGVFHGVSRLACSETAVTVKLHPLSKPHSFELGNFDEPHRLKGAVPLAGVKDAPAVLEVGYGDGRIIFVGDPFVIANNGIGEGDNARFVLNLARMAVGEGDGRIVFDDYHHGYRMTNGGLLGFLGYFRGTPIPWLVWHTVAFGLLVAYTLGRRFGRPLRLPVKPRTNALEFVTAMAQIQKAAASRDLALENLYRRFHRRLCRYTGLPTTTPLRDLCVAAGERSGRPGSEWRSVTERCQAIIDGAPTTDAELLRLARRLRELESLLPA